ncbi:stage II sporulation protein M [uncultured Methanobrevibacter sp.]|uniref:stage II sporulation protein M n=1 Tax=uncultured Methanobrevibacter sp. TaxID=253161 RepID=UPI00260C3560|nr:stage II sporulation protein M [uncultured Methanobrevibacter sp.]
MKSKLFLLSFALWTVPFLLRLSVYIEPVANDKIGTNTNSVVERVVKSIDNSDNTTTFSLIFENNIKGCFLNVFGGVLLSVGTVVNLMFNGFAAADVFRSSYDAGFPLTSILKTTLPHSFELVGFWLSGAIGFMITWQFVRFMRGKEAFSRLILKQIGLLLCVMTVLILGAAYVEAYISVNILK